MLLFTVKRLRKMPIDAGTLAETMRAHSQVQDGCGAGRSD